MIICDYDYEYPHELAVYGECSGASCRDVADDNDAVRKGMDQLIQFTSSFS